MTNHEKLKTFNVEEMAAFMDELLICKCCTENAKAVCDEKCKLHIAEWLREEAEVEKTFVCGSTNLPCCECVPVCEHRKENNNG